MSKIDTSFAISRRETHASVMREQITRPFPSCFEPHYEDEASCLVFIVKISFHFYSYFN